MPTSKHLLEVRQSNSLDNPAILDEGIQKSKINRVQINKISAAYSQRIRNWLQALALTFSVSAPAVAQATPPAPEEVSITGIKPVATLVNQVIRNPQNPDVIKLVVSAGPHPVTLGYNPGYYLSNNGGESFSGINWMSGDLATSGYVQSVFICPDNSFCEGKVLSGDIASNQIKVCSLDGDNTSNCSFIPNFKMGVGSMNILSGKILVSQYSSELPVLVDINDGSYANLANCNVGVVTGGYVNGYLYTFSHLSPTFGATDYQRKLFNPVTNSCSGSLKNMVDYSSLANINDANLQREGTMDPLTGDFYYSHHSNGKPMLAKHKSVSGDGFLSLSTGEQCEPNRTWLDKHFGAEVDAHLGGKTCATEKGAGWTGELACNSNSTFNVTNCQPPVVPPVCGNGVLEAGEQCDGLEFGGKTCETEMSSGWTGELDCNSSCEISTAACEAPVEPTCAVEKTSGNCEVDCSDLDNPTVNVGEGEGNCEVEYTPNGAANAVELSLDSNVGVKALDIPVENAGTPTVVTVPRGLNHRRVVDRGNKYFLHVGGVALGVEGTTYSAVWSKTNEGEVIFTCEDGVITLHNAGVPLIGADGRLGAGFKVVVNVDTKTVVSGPEPIEGGVGGAGGVGGSAGEGGTGGTGGVSGSAGEGGAGGTGGVSGSAGEGGTGGAGGVGGTAGEGGTGGRGGNGGTANEGGTGGHGSVPVNGGSNGIGGASTGGNGSIENKAGTGVGGSEIPAKNAASGDEGGCSMSNSSTEGSNLPLVGLGLAVGLAAARRRKRQ